MAIEHATEVRIRGGPHQIHFRLSERDFRVLHEIAEQQGEHIAAVMRRMVRSYIHQWVEARSRTRLGQDDQQR
jgi:hypothetical protein